MGEEHGFHDQDEDPAGWLPRGTVTVDGAHDQMVLTGRFTENDVDAVQRAWPGMTVRRTGAGSVLVLTLTTR